VQKLLYHTSEKTSEGCKLLFRAVFDVCCRYVANSQASLKRTEDVLNFSSSSQTGVAVASGSAAVVGAVVGSSFEGSSAAALSVAQSRSVGMVPNMPQAQQFQNCQVSFSGNVNFNSANESTASEAQLQLQLKLTQAQVELAKLQKEAAASADGK